jgi:hypothetical protein
MERYAEAFHMFNEPFEILQRVNTAVVIKENCDDVKF